MFAFFQSPGTVPVLILQFMILVRQALNCGTCLLNSLSVYGDKPSGPVAFLMSSFAIRAASPISSMFGLGEKLEISVGVVKSGGGVVEG